MARRQRKRHVQLDLISRSGKRARPKRRGKAKGGRPPKGERAGSPHKKRPTLKASEPVHVVLRVDRAVGNLRRRAIYKAFRTASIVAARHAEMRIVHMSIQRTHVHLLVEANDRLALANGMKAFQISAAKHINRAISEPGQQRRRGRVFTDRYHAEYITCPRQAHRAIGYVINNWRKHGEDRHDHARGWKIDPFSSANWFDGWKERDEIEPWPPTYEPLVVWEPRSWLLRNGWERAGSISYKLIPSEGVGR